MGYISKENKPPIPPMPECKPPKSTVEITEDYSKMIYVAGAYGGSEINKEYIEKCCREFTKKYPAYCFVNGVSQFSHWYEYSDSVIEDLKRCVALLKKCDEIWVIGERWQSSQGTMVEIFVAMENNIPVVFNEDRCPF